MVPITETAFELLTFFMQPAAVKKMGIEITLQYTANLHEFANYLNGYLRTFREIWLKMDYRLTDWTFRKV